MVRIKGNRSSSSYPESQLQDAFTEWLNLHPLLKEIHFHIANERKTSAAQGARLKRAGVRSGVPDVFIPYPTRVHHGLWVELKIKPNKPSENQISYLNKMKALNYGTRVCYSIDEAISAVESYLSHKRTNWDE